MRGSLTNKDYIKILKIYKNTIPKSKRLLKIRAEKIITQKLCKCIKKLEPTFKTASIGICTKNVLNNKGYTRSNNFSCRKKTKITLKKIDKTNKSKTFRKK